jgi:osmotically inducible protein OsmC
MPIRTADAAWEGDLKKGRGTVSLGSGRFSGPYSFASRFEEGPGTNPEELLGAAHAGCFSMAFALLLAQSGWTPRRIATQARVQIEKSGEGFRITRIVLRTRGEVPGIDRETFMKLAETAKTGCPVSQALAGTEIALEASMA